MSPTVMLFCWFKDDIRIIKYFAERPLSVSIKQGAHLGKVLVWDNKRPMALAVACRSRDK